MRVGVVLLDRCIAIRREFIQTGGSCAAKADLALIRCVSTGLAPEGRRGASLGLPEVASHPAMSGGDPTPPEYVTRATSGHALRACGVRVDPGLCSWIVNHNDW